MDNADRAAEGWPCPGAWLRGCSYDGVLDELAELNSISKSDDRTYICRKCGREEAGKDA